jgi:hypothetical protein
MTKPLRLQLSRRRGFDLQEASRAANGLPAINVARPGRWGNPYVVGRQYTTSIGNHVMTAEEAVRRYKRWLSRTFYEQEIKEALAGKNLACWCEPGSPCHADILLEVANQ